MKDYFLHIKEIRNLLHLFSMIFKSKTNISTDLMFEKNRVNKIKRCVFVIYNSYNAQKRSCQRILRKKEEETG